ncbi:MAG: V-type ATP synthase subunit E family protein [Candidatus Bathyarchaeota archaeon]|nr:V-type ATP synthase subunit E family protein [Candidatus Bathyarchaeum tardum]
MEFSQEEIINRILNEATAEAELTIKKAKESAELLLENQRQTACANAEKEANSILKRAQNEAELIRLKTITDIKRQADWIVLSEKNRLIENVIDSVKQRLMDLEKTSKYVPLLEKLTVEAGSALGGGMLTVFLNKTDSKLKLNFDKLAKEITSKTGVETKLSFSNENITAAGVVVKTFDNKIFVDNTFDSILRREEKELKIKIAQILFKSIESF